MNATISKVAIFPIDAWFTVTVESPRGLSFVARKVDATQPDDWSFFLTNSSARAADVHHSELQRVMSKWPTAMAKRQARK